MIGIIGGSGIYEGLIEEGNEIDIVTPFGKTSDNIVLGKVSGVDIAFIPRHGKKHVFPPHKVPYKANIWALKSLGVKAIIAVSAVGSLKEELKPGDFGIVKQYIDFTKLRERTFFDGKGFVLPEKWRKEIEERFSPEFADELANKVVHVSMAEPYSNEMNEIIYRKGIELLKDRTIHKDLTYITIEGPQFSTKAESSIFRQWADVIGMTGNPEVQLAREMEMCFSNIVMVTDYDCWKEEIVNAEVVKELMASSISVVKTLIKEVVPEISKQLNKLKCYSLDNSVV